VNAVADDERPILSMTVRQIQREKVIAPPFSVFMGADRVEVTRLEGSNGGTKVKDVLVGPFDL
jgi:hypothetical protein